jgi:DNA-binding response OmpR family regulator
MIDFKDDGKPEAKQGVKRLVPHADGAFELGKLHFDRCDFVSAVPHLLEASANFLRSSDFPSYLKTQNILMRIYAEREELDAISQMKESLQDLVLKEGFELSAKTYYTLALCSFYRDQYDSSLEYLQKSLSIALATDSKEDICYAINGLGIYYFGVGKVEQALKEIYNLQVFFQVLQIPEIKIGSQILNARIQLQLGRAQESLDILWQAYDLLKEHKSVTMYIYLLFNMGKAHTALGDKDMARMYLSLALKSLDGGSLPRLYKAIREDLEKVTDGFKSVYDLVFNLEDHVVVEKKLGRIDFKNQFILLDLLKLFVQNQGQVYSKELLVEKVWKQDYDPSVHDNKIYVTIKRLRKMIEPDFDRPKYIFRAKNGYFMNKSAKVFFDIRGEN